MGLLCDKFIQSRILEILAFIHSRKLEILAKGDAEVISLHNRYVGILLQRYVEPTSFKNCYGIEI